MSLPDVPALATELRGGSVRALARGLTWVEAADPRGEALCDRLFPYTGRAHIVGITGYAGSGKSTLVGALGSVARARGLTVGILAIDPSSPLTGGSILGDRVRMTDLARDPGVFVRSMATRGALGGLCCAAADAIDLFDASGKDLVLVETVGVGQDEVEVMRTVDTVVVVSVPGLGDEIQALKAGVLETADIHVVNKADREGANRTIADLRSMLGQVPVAPGQWETPVVDCVATEGHGVETVLDTIKAHFESLCRTGELSVRRARILDARVVRTTQQMIADRISAHDRPANRPLLEQVRRRELSPRACARIVLAELSRTERNADV